MPCAGPVVGCPPREAALPPVGHYINAHYNFSTATCQTLLYWVQFTVLPLARLFHWFQFTALPLARLYRMSTSLQRCHCQTFALISIYQPSHLPDFIALFSVCSRATCQTLFHWFQFTVLPLVRPYGIGFSLQPCHWSDFVSLVSVCNPDACQTLFHGYSLQSCRLSDFISLVSACSPATCQI